MVGLVLVAVTGWAALARGTGTAEAVATATSEAGEPGRTPTEPMESVAAAPKLKTLQTIDACYHPIGITYDRSTRRVWVACYTGSIRVYNDW